MFKRENAIINENQNSKAHFLTNFIIFHFKNINSKNDSDIEKRQNK